MERQSESSRGKDSQPRGPPATKTKSSHKDSKMTNATAMTTDAAQISKVAKASSSHAVFLNAITDLFHWFQEAVSGYEAVDDMDKKVTELESAISADEFMPEYLQTVWASYTRSLKSAYGNFGRDVVHQHGFDEPARIRNLALNIAGGSFKESRSRAREFLVNQIEGAFSIIQGN